VSAAGSAEEAVEVARRIGYPVVMKVDSPDIVHRSDVGGVVLSLLNDDQVIAAHRGLLESVSRRAPDATLRGVTIQPMVDTKAGFEMIMGAKKDRVFGSVILVGTGGVTAEAIADRALGLPPLNERLALRMLEHCRCWPILEGFRGQPGMNVDRLIEVLMRLSYLIADCPEILGLDVNPLLVTRRDVIALDARIVIGDETPSETRARFSHLAIPPYPEQFERRCTMADGTPVLLRPIKAEDEPMWHQLLRDCSPETIRARFQSLFHGTTHSMAARACYVDYDRELAIVAEVGDGSSRRIVGVTRLASDPDHHTAELGILVGDAWQNRGLGTTLARHCLELAEHWHIRRVTAMTSGVNRRMVHIFEKLGFALERQLEDNTVLVSKTLGEPESVEQSARSDFD
jgi:acetyltransferase